MIPNEKQEAPKCWPCGHRQDGPAWVLSNPHFFKPLLGPQAPGLAVIQCMAKKCGKIVAINLIVPAPSQSLILPGR